MGLSNLRQICFIFQKVILVHKRSVGCFEGGFGGGRGVSAVTSNTGDVDTIQNELGSIDTK